MYHLQGASYVLVSYLKAEMFMLFVIYCECWWPHQHSQYILIRAGTPTLLT
jgi:hypothetical protein